MKHFQNDPHLLKVKDLASGTFFEDEFGDICYKSASRITTIRNLSGLVSDKAETVSCESMSPHYSATRVLDKAEVDQFTFSKGGDR